MAVNLSPVAGAAAQFFDNSGNVLTGGKLYTYDAGTTTPAVTYTNSSGATAHPNPIILNAAGRVPDSGEIWLADSVSYKFVLKDQNDVLIGTYDNLIGINSNFVNFTGEEEQQTATQGQTVFTLATLQYQPATNNLLVFVNGSKQISGTNYNETSSTVVTFIDGLNVGDVVDFCTATPINTSVISADQVSYNEGGVGAVTRTVESKLQEFVSVKDFGAVGDGVADDTAAIQAALDLMAYTTYQGTVPNTWAKGGGTVYFPPGTYKITSGLIIGSSTRLVGYGPIGQTAISTTDNTGVIIDCDFTDLEQWALSAFVWDTDTDAPATYNAIYIGTDIDNQTITLCHAITIEGLSINGNGCYGGIRLTGSSECNLKNVLVQNVGVGYLFNGCYGYSYDHLYALTGIIGIAHINCTAFNGGHTYSNYVESGWTITTSNTLVNQYDMSTDAFMPSDAWRTYSYGTYMEGCLDANVIASTNEHYDVGFAATHVQFDTLTGYCEVNTNGNFGFVACSGNVSVFANTVASGDSYNFGVNNNLTLSGCSYNTIYVGNTQNTIVIDGGDNIVQADWDWNDDVIFSKVNSFLVSATGSTSAVYGYTTLNEALRRISISSLQDWSLIIKDGDTVPTTSQLNFNTKNIRFVRQSNSTKPIISVGAAGGGYIYRWQFSGNCDISFENVDITFPASPAAVAGDNALINTGIPSCVNLQLAVLNSTINLGDAYSLLGTFTGSTMNLISSFAGDGITSVNPAPLLRNTGSALISNIQAGTTVDANIKALGTNGWQGTVLNSNF